MTTKTSQAELYQQCATELATLISGPIYLPDDNPNPNEQEVQGYFQTVESRGVRPANSTLMYNFFLLGRALHHMGTSVGRKMLHKWASKKRVEYFYVIATRCYELFRARGEEYIGTVRIISPSRLRCLSRDSFHNLCMYAEMLRLNIGLEEVLQEQDA